MVLRDTEYSGTHYETPTPLMDDGAGTYSVVLNTSTYTEHEVCIFPLLLWTQIK
jgi:hypothetical protein